MTEDTSINPAPLGEETDGVKLYASLNSLSVDGVPPQIGDSVAISVEGTVKSIENGQACIAPVTVNGEPVQMPQQPPSLRDQAYDSMAALDADGDKD